MGVSSHEIGYERTGEHNGLIEQTVIVGNLADVMPLEWLLVNHTEQEMVWDQLVRKYHYLGYQKLIGQRMKYLIQHQGRPLAAISYNRPARRVEARDAYIGWSETNRGEQLKYIVTNNRFLILPWVRIRYLASHLLAYSLRQVRKDWEQEYGVQPILAETFIDIAQYAGTCYKAANWIYVGQTRGFGKRGNSYNYHGQKKAVYLYELDHDFRRKLNCEQREIRPTPSKENIEEAITVLLGKPDWDQRILEDCGLDEQAVSQLGSDLKRYLQSLRPACHTVRQYRLITIFVKGLFSDLDRKSIEPIALRYSGKTGVRNMQIFFKNGKVSQEKLLTIHQRNAAALLGEADGMLNVDGSDFPKKGKNSVGVIRQHCGVLGKTDNCQAGVFVGYSSRKGYTLLDRRLYMPEQWFKEEYSSLRSDCEVPQEQTFKTKNHLAAEMIQQAAQQGIPYRWIGCDSAFGVDRDFLSGLPEDSYYFADVHSDNLVWLRMPEMIIPQRVEPGKGGRPHKHPRPSCSPVSVSDIAQDDRYPWKRIVLAEGSKGPILAKTKCMRIIRAGTSTRFGNYVIPLDEVWLYIREYENGRIKYSFSNAPADIARSELDRAATMRWPIEQCFGECKGNLGMDQYETRSWQAWHLHMLLVMIAHLFTISLRQLFKKNTNSIDANGKSPHLGKSLGRQEDNQHHPATDRLSFETEYEGISIA